MNNLRNILCALCIAAAAANAQDTLKILPQGNEPSHLIAIDVQKLPEMVREKISGDEYNSWVVQHAYKSPGKSTGENNRRDSVYYVVEMKKGDETIRVWFDPDGNKKED